MPCANMRSRLLRRGLMVLLAGVLALGAVACGDDDGGGQPVDGQQEQTDADTGGY